MTTPIIGEGEKLITTVLLNGERLHVRVHPHANGQNVFDAIVEHIGLNEITYFGLMIIKDGEQQFLNLDDKLNKLSKYAPHLWRDDGNCNSSLVFTVFFRVKYYVENICLLQEQQTRHQYYLQLRKDVLESSVRVHDDTSMVLASYALQAELGDYDRNIHGLDYFVPQHYLPAKTIAKLTIPYIKNALPAMHQSHRGLTEGQAEIEFLKEAQKLSEYGVLFHRVYKKEYNKKVPYNLGICVRGLVVYDETGPIRNPVCKHAWSKVKKMSFKRSKFIVECDSPNPHHAKMMFYTANYKRSRYLLKISSSFFNFQMMMASRLAMLPEYLPQEDPLPPPAVPSLPSVRIESASNQDLIDGGDMQTRSSIPNSREHASTTAPSVRETPKSKPKPKAEVKQYTLDLLKRDGSFGFSIVGGIELGGIFVNNVTPGGPAAHSQQINAGDRIVQINKDSFENVTRREAIMTLRNAPDKSRFIMESFGQNLVIEADACMMTPLGVSKQSLVINQPQVPIPHTDKAGEIVKVELGKRDNSFGIGFTGGPELGGVYVKSLVPHGAAEADGRIAIGDRILEIDQINVENFSRKKILETLKQSSGTAIILLERYKPLPGTSALMNIDHEKVLRSNQNFISIKLNKKNDSLGFSITGGLELGGIFVKYINPNGSAAMDGRLEVGDRVVAVHDLSLETATRQKALEIIRNATSPVNLIIEKCVAPGNGTGDASKQTTQIMRSDSIKSLPIKREPRSNILHSRGVTYSMQHLPNSEAAHDMNGNYRDKSTGGQKTSARRFCVNLAKQNGSFGVSLTGGIQVGGIYIKAVQSGGAADQDGHISKGDRVIEINSRKMDGLACSDAVEWLKSCEVATLVLERFSHSPQKIQPQQSSQYSSFDGDIVEIQLYRKNNTFGLCLLGGPELKGIFIKDLMAGGPAATDGRLAKGDRLIEINGVNLDGLSHHQANDLLKQAPSSVNLVIEKIYNVENIPLLDIDEFSVEIRKGDAGIGVSLTGGPELGGIYIKGILPGGAADMNRTIMKGDRILEVNGISMDGLTKQQASDLLRKAPPITNLLMERNAAFDNLVLPESDFFTVELHKKQSGYGLNLTGGPEIDGVYVKQVQRDSAADNDGRIKKGDRLITINGRNVENATRQKCTEMLKLSQNIAVLHLERCVVGDDLPPLDTVRPVVKLTKGESGFGMSLTGGTEIGGIFVKALMAGGAAEKDGRILIGDRVVEMDGVSLDGFTRQQATELLKNSAPTATFVLERYKQPVSKSVRKARPTHSSPAQHQTSSPTMTQQFMFPLFHGVAPSVPPRHHTNGIPSRESAFKRLEQQQLKLANQSPLHQIARSDGMITIQHGVPVSVQHNVQGSPVSSRIPSMIQRQFSLEKTASQNSSSHEPPYHVGNGSLHQPVSETGPLSLIEGPMRAIINNEVHEDSPQKFLQHFSKSVASSQAKPVQSRIPMGPVSSVIFGKNRDNRNVHEIHDLRDNVRDSNRQFRENAGLISTYQESVQQEGSSFVSNGNVTSNNVVCLQNGRPDVQQIKQMSITTNPMLANETNESNYTTTDNFHHTTIDDPYSDDSVSDNQESFFNAKTSSEANRKPSTEYGGMVKVQTREMSSGHRGEAMTIVSPTTNETFTVPPISEQHLSTVDHSSHESKKKPAGLQWISLNDNGTTDNDSGNMTSVSHSHSNKRKQSDYPGMVQPVHSDDRYSESPTHMSKDVNNLSAHARHESLTHVRRDTNSAPTRAEHDSPTSSRRDANSVSAPAQHVNNLHDQISSVPSSNTIPVSLASRFNASPITSSNAIPVPLASRFNIAPNSSTKAGEYIYEVTLFKDSRGLGMNLAGGGSPENPVTIKKIAPGTAADESGQLRVGDVILEINGKPVSHLSSKDVITILRACPSEVQLLAKRSTFDQTYPGQSASFHIGL